ncbi:hypothetical protein AAMO2058_001617600 [Amorphochlora amoebiformis]
MKEIRARQHKISEAVADSEKTEERHKANVNLILNEVKLLRKEIFKLKNDPQPNQHSNQDLKN